MPVYITAYATGHTAGSGGGSSAEYDPQPTPGDLPGCETDTFTRSAGPFDAAGGFVTNVDIGLSDAGLSWQTYDAGSYGGYADGEAVVTVGGGVLRMEHYPTGGVGYAFTAVTLPGVGSAALPDVAFKLKFDDFLANGQAYVQFELLRYQTFGFLSDFDRMTLQLYFSNLNGNAVANGTSCVVITSFNFDRRASLGGSTTYWHGSTYTPTGGAATPGFEWVPGTWYNVRWDQNGTTSQRIKIWEDGDVEPGTWLSDHSYLTQGGGGAPGSLPSRPTDLAASLQFTIFGDADEVAAGDLDFSFDDLNIEGVSGCE